MRSVKRISVVFALLIVVLAGCSSGGAKVAAGDSTTTTAAAGQAAGQGGFQAYSDCLKQHGVDLPARGGQGAGQGGAGGQRPPGAGGQPPAGGQRPPQSLPPGVDQKTFDAAQSACASKRPTGGFGGGGGANNTAFAAYASCLADHGVTVTTAGTGTQQRQQIDRTDPDFAAADTACAALRPQAGAPGSPTTTAAGGQS